LKEQHYEKQTQFAKGQNERNSSYNIGLWKFWQTEAARKQSQFRAQMIVLSFLPRMRVRDKLRQSRKGRLTAESKVLGVPGFRIKCGMTGL